MTIRKKVERFSQTLSDSVQELSPRKLLSYLDNTLPARSWIETNFQKRECIKFIPDSKDELRCGCGRLASLHYHLPSSELDFHRSNETWQPSKHTKSYSTDAYGTIEFQGGAHPTKAEYVRVSYDTRPELLLQLFTREWNLELPKLLITVQGGKANFELQGKLKKVLRKGLLKAAKTTGAWIFTGGTNTGVTRQVGDALLNERCQRNGRVVSLGIAPWGIVENNVELIGANRDVPFHSVSSPRSKLAALNNRHSYFLLVDNGTYGKYGAEIVLRRKLEKFISNQRLHPYTYSSTPVVCLVIEGGTNTIRAVLEYVTDDPPVPVVVCDGSGRAADLIAFVHKYASDTDTEEQPVLDSMREYLTQTIERTFEVGAEQASKLYDELILCTKRRHLITVFRPSEEKTEDHSQHHELDQTILTALFRSQQLIPTEQLSLALTWNRVDIARSEIFVYGQEWPEGALEEAMMQALEHDRTDFVRLLLENGVSMRKFLTIPRLEELYNTRRGPGNTLGYILRDVRPNIPRGYVYTLHDIGLVINKLMGGAYRAFYTRRRFRPIYAKVMNKTPQMSTHHNPRNSGSSVRYYGNAMSLIAEALPHDRNLRLFEFPFNELMIWAVLMKRQKMALLMWQHGEEALAKALVSCKLYKAMAHEAAEDDMETEVYEELKSYAKEFETISLELLDFCYREDDEKAEQLLTCELQNWSGQTCLSLAVTANHRALLAHACSQVILADLWLGGLRTRKNTNVKVILSLFFPGYIFYLEFKSKEELQQMPQTEEEHWQLENDDDDDDDDKSDSDDNKGIDSETLLRETVVQESGKASEIDSTEDRFYFPEKTRTNKPLKLKKKLYEFYTAPITKFWAHSIAYVGFLIIFSYTVLVKMSPIKPSWQEQVTIAYIFGMGCEKIREIASTEPRAVAKKLRVWSSNVWNPCDATAIFIFFVGLSLRLSSPYDVFVAGRLIYCVNIVYWYLRILNILGVNKYLGPLVTMMGKMVKNMIYFVVLLLVVLMSFGVCRQAILNPNNEPNWYIVRDIFLEPYFMLYGEVYADKIDPECVFDKNGENVNPDADDTACNPGRWITPAIMSVYLLVANILLINLLIAVFNNIFIEVNAISHQVWMFQRFTVVMEYEQKPILPPPFILFCHLYLIYKYLKRRCDGNGNGNKMERGRETSYDNGLKLFLDKEDMETLYDFEEECVEAYLSEKEQKVMQSIEERVRVTYERVEMLAQKSEEAGIKEEASRGIEFRLAKVEEASSEILSHLAVIHRFMAANKINNEEEEEKDNDNDDDDSTKEDDVLVVEETEREEVEEEREDWSLDDVASLTNETNNKITKFRKRRDPTRKYSEGESSTCSSKYYRKRRLTSQTQSEPENMAITGVSSVALVEPTKIKLRFVPPNGSKSLLVSLHSEYTSITDELETVRGLLSPPVTPSATNNSKIPPRKRLASEMSNPEIALYIEKEYLKDAEESDYIIMENLIQKRLQEEKNEMDEEERNANYLQIVDECNKSKSSRLLRDFALEISTNCSDADDVIVKVEDANSLLKTETEQDKSDALRMPSETMC